MSQGECRAGCRARGRRRVLRCRVRRATAGASVEMSRGMRVNTTTYHSNRLVVLSYAYLRRSHGPRLCDCGDDEHEDARRAQACTSAVLDREQAEDERLTDVLQEHPGDGENRVVLHRLAVCAVLNNLLAIPAHRALAWRAHTAGVPGRCGTQSTDYTPDICRSYFCIPQLRQQLV